MPPRLYLNFHGVGEPHAGVDAGEKPYWVSVERLNEILALAGARPDIGVTFDDGNISDLTLALPALQHYGLKADFFIPTERIGAPFYLSAGDLRALREQGMGIGSHGLVHTAWTDLSDADLAAEIGKPLDVLSEIIGESVDSVGVPFGAYDSRVMGFLRRRGVTRVYTSDGGPCRPGAWLIPRNSIRSDMALSEIEAMLDRPRGAAAYYFRAAKRVSKRVVRGLAG